MRRQISSKSDTCTESIGRICGGHKREGGSALPDGNPTNLKHIEDEDKYVCRPREWHKFLHAMYFGRLYCWKKNALVIPVHLDKYEFYVESGNWVEDFHDDLGDSLEGTNWHDENHPDAEYGGYWKTHKTQKYVCWPENDSNCCIDLAKNFKAATRKTFKSTNWTIPPAKIWMDSLKKWW